MSKWWDGKPEENLYLEVTRRDDIGVDLNAPVADRAGTSTGGYSLVPLVQPSDLIVHYDSREREIVGASVALGLPEPRAVYWVARGRSAREAGAQPAWLSGIAVPLGGYRSLTNPVTLGQIQQRRGEILGIREQLQRVFGSEVPLHFPWYEYGPGGPIRTQQSYLLKFPRSALGLFPDLATTVAAIERDWKAAGSRLLPELDEVAEAIEKAAGRTPGSLRRRSLGQGFATDQEAKVAVESRARMSQSSWKFGEDLQHG